MTYPRQLHLLVIVTSLLSLTVVAFTQSFTQPCVATTCAYTADIAFADCNGRQLKCLPLSFNQAINMDMGQNAIQRLPRSMLAGYLRLKSLDLNNNLISVIEDHAFGSMKTLTTLTLSFNRITQLGMATFSGLLSIQALYLQGNSIVSIHANAFNGLTQMQELNIAGNRLVTLPASVFSQLINLRRLMLQENQLRTNNRFLNGLDNLIELDLDGNRFVNLPDLSGMRMLGDLEITDSNIQRIRNNSFSHCGRIKELILASNFIDTIEPEGLSGLRSVTDMYLSFNSLKTLPINVFSKLVYMERLFLQNNLLTSLSGTHFATLTRLRALYLGNNQLKVFPPLPASRSLTILDLTANNLSTMTQDMIVSLPLLNRLLLTKNPLICDCRLKFLRRWFINQGRAHRPLDLPTCDVPILLSGTRLTMVPAGGLSCTPPTVRVRAATVGVTEGQNITLECSGSGGFPSPTITWRSPSNQRLIPDVRSGRYLVSDDGPLMIIRATMSDTGLFTCVGSNPAGTVTAPVQLKIQANPNPPAATVATSVIFTPVIGITGPPVRTTTMLRPTTQAVEIKTTPESPSGGVTPLPTTETPRQDEDRVLDSNPRLPDSNEEDLPPNHTVCDYNPGKVIIAIFITFFLTCLLCVLLFWSWYHRLIPKFISRSLNLRSLKNKRLSRNIVPTRARAPLPYSQMLSEGVYMRPSSLSGSDDSVSTSSSFEQDNRYVITESIVGPEGFPGRQTMLNKRGRKPIPGPSDSQHTYINADVVVNDSNYTALCTGKDERAPSPHTIPRKQVRRLPNTDGRGVSTDSSRIYMDLS
ncbi:leucine-rich repeat and immunoglobulin-like domain-containing nogo receptor-interacting protein 1 [Asterias rubens]|uniref:leucine-rich repeat and immunoglobulin-like domain-containing nogo receptor-interacting protein 1 n=1 Tax=Asterias rubens TaxID=7604 RepID=UPI001455B17A|nr:leucine-rich repeat and immunoglobulin-like domain-containing nogo receptor-interacting protein 1 [Asterias rubens]XP_033639688.1 leucine-rich repeat and immunoglobulin-like domain-containing nogo receptor-interacting protein 1 [Asterias rubens]